MMKLDERFERGFAEAFRYHGGQCRKGTKIPYMGHLLAVAAIVIDDGGSQDEVIAALLHDAAEDQGGEKTLDEIRAAFGDDVAGMVRALSDTTVKPKPPWRERKEKYLAHLESVEDTRVLRISLADKLHNARAIALDRANVGDAVWERFNASKEESLWLYGRLADIFRRRMPGPLADEFIRRVERLSA
jgi:(p)ppGpp synthase/HD superfamily hydrolase